MALAASGWAVPAWAATADLTGPCAVTLTGSTSGAVDAASTHTWHVVRADTLTASVLTTDATPTVKVSAALFGIAVPVGSGQGSGHGALYTLGKVSDYAIFTRVLAVSAATGSCSGTVVATIDNAFGLLTLVGGGGLVVGLAGLVLAVRAGWARPSRRVRAAGVFGGLLFGLGAGAVLQELGPLDPTSWLDLLFPIALAIAGGVTPGLLRREPSPPPPPQEQVDYLARIR